MNLAVDDFGTGYATLAWLQRLPFNALKIDRMFIAEVTGEGPGVELVRYTTQLAHAMGKVVVAEGVESTEQWSVLQRLGCDHAQGFGIGRPMPRDEFGTWLRLWEAKSLQQMVTGPAPGDPWAPPAPAPDLPRPDLPRRGRPSRLRSDPPKLRS